MGPPSPLSWSPSSSLRTINEAPPLEQQLGARVSDEPYRVPPRLPTPRSRTDTESREMILSPTRAPHLRRVDHVEVPRYFFASHIKVRYSPVFCRDVI